MDQDPGSSRAASTWDFGAACEKPFVSGFRQADDSSHYDLIDLVRAAMDRGEINAEKGANRRAESDGE